MVQSSPIFGQSIANLKFSSEIQLNSCNFTGVLVEKGLDSKRVSHKVNSKGIGGSNRFRWTK